MMWLGYGAGVVIAVLLAFAIKYLIGARRPAQKRDPTSRFE